MPEFKVITFGFYRTLPWDRHGRKALVVLSSKSGGLELAGPICSRTGTQP